MHYRLRNIIVAAAFVALAATTPVRAQSPNGTSALAISISVESPDISEPFPARVTLHFYNAGSRPLWLYRPVRDIGARSRSALGPSPGGSTLAVHLSRADGTASETPAVGTVLRTVGMPQPRLEQLTPGGSGEETVAVRISPATRAGSAAPLWGVYQLSVAYSASYANGNSLTHDLGVDIWQGSITSNAVAIQLSAAPAASSGSVSGTVVSRQMQPNFGILVSLSDANERVIAQKTTGYDGTFSFSHLPFGRYWVTVRRPGAGENSGFFEHADLSESQPQASLKMIMLSPEEYEAKELRHKPVLFRITDNAGAPVADATLAILWSSGTIMENLRVMTDANGFAVANLLPGSNYVTIRKRHCPKLDQMADVAAGRGIDGFAMTLDCGK
jgi:hypothetical protein